MASAVGTPIASWGVLTITLFAPLSAAGGGAPGDHPHGPRFILRKTAHPLMKNGGQQDIGKTGLIQVSPAEPGQAAQGRRILQQVAP